MKYFNRKIYAIYQNELTEMDKTDLFNYYLAEVSKVQRSIPKEYPRIGIIDTNDLIQESSLAFLSAWEQLDWEWINGLTEEERPAAIWGYLKRRITDRVKRAINNNRNGVRVPEYLLGAKEDTLQQAFEVLFPDFFKLEYRKGDIQDDVSAWDIEMLAIGLDEALDNALSFKEKDILYRTYGIDCEKQNQQEIAKHYKMSHGSVRNAVSYAIKKLKQNELTEKIIKKHHNFA